VKKNRSPSISRLPKSCSPYGSFFAIEVIEVPHLLQYGAPGISGLT
jgi:hypothetical protein